ncbi:MAG: hypothetical protein WDM71_09530 [Ferruginibacter sp.]
MQKKIIASKVQAYLSKKIRTRVLIGAIDYRLPEWIEIRNVYIEDQQKDTLLYGGKLAVEINLLKLIKGETDIRKISLENIKANVYRNAGDSNYNFQFIVNAFASPKATKKDTSALNITLKEFEVYGFSFTYKDDYGGNHLTANIKDLDITVNKFQPDKMLFDLNKIKINYSSIQYVSFKTINSTASSANSSTGSLHISLKSLQLNNDNIKYDDDTKLVQKKGLDPAHLDIKIMRANVSDIIYNTDSIMAVINQFAFKEKSGLTLDTTHARITYSNKKFFCC